MRRMRIPATTANMGPGFDCIGMAFDFYNYIDFEPVDELEYCELTSGGDAGSIDLSKNNLIYTEYTRMIAEISFRIGIAFSDATAVWKSLSSTFSVISTISATSSCTFF